MVDGSHRVSKNTCVVKLFAFDFEYRQI